MISLAKKRIKDVFDDTIKEVRSGQRPNVSKSMIKHGYSVSSARAQKVVKTKTWEKLLAKIDDEAVLDMLQEIVEDKGDKRARIAAGVELLKLKDRYPAQKTKVMGLFSVLDSLEEDSKE